jgi:hypothetical protein
MAIIFGILLSVLFSFILGAIIQFISRLFFSFNYQKTLSKYGALWGAIALSSITYFILIKGLKGSIFLNTNIFLWIKDHNILLILAIFTISVILLQFFLLLRINILKIIILVGTFALALAFSANDLVNFIGVPIAGYQAFKIAITSSAPLTISMAQLGHNIKPESFLLIIAGLIMIATLWLSKKARTVSNTELSLGTQNQDHEENYDSTFLSRIIVKMFLSFSNYFTLLLPSFFKKLIRRRFSISNHRSHSSFDLLRASVNLMVASAVISYATSYKLPLSTTYVTFMVSMGTSFADRAWGRESAVYRITGVITVIGGWFMTAILAFSVACLFAAIIFKFHAYGIILLILLMIFSLWRNHSKHQKKILEEDKENIFNLKKVSSLSDTVSTTFQHMLFFQKEIHSSLNTTLEYLFLYDPAKLGEENRKIKKIKRWANIIIANIFKTLRHL